MWSGSVFLFVTFLFNRKQQLKRKIFNLSNYQMQHGKLDRIYFKLKFNLPLVKQF